MDPSSHRALWCTFAAHNCHAKHRQPVPNPPKGPQDTAQRMKTFPSPCFGLCFLHSVRYALLLPGLEKSAREAVLNAA